MNELEDAEVRGPLLLGEAALRAQPGASKRPQAFQSVEVDLTDAIAVVLARVFATGVTDGFVAIAPVLVWHASVDVIRRGLDQGALGEGVREDRLERPLLDSCRRLGQHLNHPRPTALDHAEKGRLLRLQSAASAGALQSPPPGPPLVLTSGGGPL